MNKLSVFIIASLTLISACGGGSGGGEENSPPAISGTPADFTRAGDTYSFRPQASDPDGDLLTFEIRNAPAWLFFDAGSGEVTGFPTTDHFGPHRDIVISVSDGIESASLTFSLDVFPALLSRDNFTPLGMVTDTGNGYEVDGTMVMTIEGKEQRFEDSNLILSFDEEGNLLDIAGDTIVPEEVSDSLALEAGTRATIGMLSGAEINADPDFDITLKEELYYFVYYFGAGLDVVINTEEQRDGSGSSGQLTLSTPLGGEILFITDPNDPFYYYFASIGPLPSAGKGDSFHGFIPFVPDLDYPELASFDGHMLDKASIDVGIKIFDFLTIEGERVIDLPIPGRIDHDDLFASPVDFNMGYNGDANFGLSVLGVGVFDFDLAQASATLSVSALHQQMAMQTIIAPDVSWQPDWFTILPTTEIVGEWSVEGSGQFEATLRGDYESTIPAARMSGSMMLDNAGARFEARIPDAQVPIAVSAEFDGANERTTFFVDAEVDLSGQIAAEVNQAFDDIVDDKLAALQDLQDATDQYQINVSLNGFRTAIPPLVNALVPFLQGLPTSVGDTVYDRVYDEIKDRQVTVGFCPACTRVPSNSAIAGYARTAENTVVDDLTDALAPVIRDLQTLSARAQEADDASLRVALEQALRNVYDRRNLDITIRGTINLPSPVPDYNWSHRENRKILTDSQAALVLAGANHASQIQASSDLVISTGQIFDAIPVEDAVETARDEVNNGLAQIPTFEGAGMTVERGTIDAFILLDGTPYGIEGVNLLDPVDLLSGVTRKAAEVLAGGG